MNYTRGTKIGSGASAKVYECFKNGEHHHTTQYAMKMVSKEKYKDSTDEVDVLNECKILSSLSNPFIIKLIDYYETKDFVCAILEYMPSDLFAVASEHVLDEETASVYIRQLVTAVSYLHAKGIMHRDIKLENCATSGYKLKLIDFGFATTETVCDKLCGTLDYMAPEMWKGDEYTNAIDVWAIGVCAYELVTGTTPFDECTSFKDMPKSFEIKLPDNLSADCKDFISKTMTIDPAQRPKCVDLLMHPFITRQPDHNNKTRLTRIDTY